MHIKMKLKMFRKWNLQKVIEKLNKSVFYAQQYLIYSEKRQI